MVGMMQTVRKLLRISAQIVALSLALSASAQANTLVRISTTFGDFTLELFDDVAPVTVQNFLNYVNRGDFNGSYFHRLSPNFVLQGGGYRFQPFVGPVAIKTDPPIVNEFKEPNVRGTIAMAKFDGDPNSATSQWFINLADNTANLDAQNGGFTVFGRVLGDGMAVMDQINALSVFNLGTLNSELPLHGFGSADSLTAKNFVTMNAEVVQRHSAALNVFEYQSGIMMLTVDGGEALGVYSLNLSLVDDQNGVKFRLNPDSLVLLAIVPEGRSSFTSADNKLRIPQLELNNNGSVRVIRNVVLSLVDAATNTFVLESYTE